MRLVSLLPVTAAFALTLATTCASPQPPGVAPAAPQAGAASSATQPSTTTAAPGAPAVALTLDGQNSQARYVVNETLANRPLPSDAIGATKAVSGTLAFDSTGQVVSAQSKIVVNVQNLTSNANGRDNYLRRNTLKTDQYPDVTFAPKSAEGMTFPLPASGNVSFKLLGDLTVRDVTTSVVWHVSATMNGSAAAGKASTSFAFADVKLDKPSVALVLSVADTIRLEIDFAAKLTDA